MKIRTNLNQKSTNRKRNKGKKNESLINGLKRNEKVTPQHYF